jgi:TolB-like protein/DNA-binding winged helix-turn-helix (wHTH) protein/Flp pilus assembly protein TadD
LPTLAASGVFVFENYRLDLDGGGLFRGSEDGHIPVALGSRALDILELLVERRGELVTKEQIFAAVWPNMAIEESNLTVQVAALRRVLDESRASGSCIQTVKGRGYRFVAPVVREAEHGFAQTHSAVATVDTSSTVFRQDDGGQSRRPRALTPPSPSPPVQHSRLVIAAASLIFAFAVVGGAWLAWPRPAATPAFVQTAPAPRLSIVVLPFANLSDDPGQDYFVDAVTDDVTTDLSRLEGSFVISRNSAITYRDKQLSPKQIGRELGVRYVVEGSIRRSGGQIRVNVQLIDSQTASHLWAERFDRDITDLFALESEITSRIAIALDIAMSRVEATRPTENPDALDYIFRARALGAEPPTRENAAKVIALLEQALALDPKSAEIKVRLALARVARVLLQMSNNRTDDLARTESLLASISSGNPRAHWAKAQLLRAQGQYAEAIPEYEAAIALNPNLAGAYGNLGHTKLLTGSLEEVVPLVEKAIRLSPRDRDLGYWYDLIGLTHLLHSRANEAIAWLERARTASPARPFIHADLAAAYGFNGEIERAVAELAEARKLSDDPERYSSLASRGRFSGASLAPNVRALYQETYELGMRRAGMPGE